MKDSRQQAGKHRLKDEYFDSAGIRQVSAKLPYGDYALMVTRSVDTKKDLYELHQCLTADHDRFARELAGARYDGCTLYVLTETRAVSTIGDLESWEEPKEHLEMRVRTSGNKHARRIKGSTMVKAMRTMSSEYGTVFMFCRPERAGQTVEEILEGRYE